MILLNLEALSDSELQYIAKQENIKNWNKLSREELIETIQDIYGGDEKVADTSGSSVHKYFNSFINPNNADLTELPGVEPLPENYNETFIRVVQIDPNWAYAFWNVSEAQLNQLKASDSSKLIVRVKVESKDKKESYDIETLITDTCWNIELPWKDAKYSFHLLSYCSGNEEELCASAPITTRSPLIASNSKILKEKKRYNIHLKGLITNSGELINNEVLANIVEPYLEGEKNEEQN